ncbi:hypothetical protein [Winogradskyella sp.]|uniref:hypothetical protein n=1 Tax=Winogradskyella sp. TaxID=1883156 RepID=UPI002628B44B|nr:hypothetical protein [Winogradskyella sp.]
MSAILNIDFNKVDQPMFYTATELTTDEILSSGTDIEKVVEEADKTGKEFVLNYITNPKYNFIF